MNFIKRMKVASLRPEELSNGEEALVSTYLPYPSIHRELGSQVERILEAIESDPDSADFINKLVCRILPKIVQSEWGKPGILRDNFNHWQTLGFNLISTGNKSPIPNVSRDGDLFLNCVLQTENKIFEFSKQKHNIFEIFDKVGDVTREYFNEKNALNRNFYFGNHQFEAVDAELLYAVVRYYKPKQVIEYGIGSNTTITADALLANALEGIDATYTSYDVDDKIVALREQKGLPKIIKQEFARLNSNDFSCLESGDLLLLDTSHIFAPGSDVFNLIFNILPNLQSGVIVHIHDIFLPRYYPANWVADEHIFWNEQYALLSYLSGDSSYEILFSASVLNYYEPEFMKIISEKFVLGQTDPGSLYIRKI
jgi:hypothetical protein